MSDLRKPGCDDPILIEGENDPRYDGGEGAERALAGHRRAPAQLGSGV